MLQSSLANCLNAADAKKAQQVTRLIRAPQPFRLTMSILTDDPLAPLGPGGPCVEKNTERSQSVSSQRSQSLLRETQSSVTQGGFLF